MHEPSYRPPVAELVRRLDAWSHDERLGDGMLLRHAAETLTYLQDRLAQVEAQRDAALARLDA